jgi:hypothetical protein
LEEACTPPKEPTTTNSKTAKEDTRIAALVFMDIKFFFWKGVAFCKT